MRVASLEFHDLETGWHLKETTFDGLNLLVGASGVGKTKILRALAHPVEAAFGGSPMTNASWTLTFESAGKQIVWRAHVVPADSTTSPYKSVFESESIQRDGELLVERTQDKFTFGRQDIPTRLGSEHSAWQLLNREAEFQPLLLDLMQFAWFRPSVQVVTISRQKLDDIARLIAPEGLLRIQLRAEERSTNSTLHAYLLDRAAPTRFAEVKERYCDIFPVDDVGVAEHELGDGNVALTLRIKDRGSARWIEEPDMSDGMLRTLKLLVELTFASPGSVFLFDEIENGMGTNCLPAVAELIQTRSDCQFFITSHHPYVIDKLPLSSWRIVRRRGSEVTVTPASEIRALSGASHHRAFTLLLNSEEYLEALS